MTYWSVGTEINLSEGVNENVDEIVCIIRLQNFIGSLILPNI